MGRKYGDNNAAVYGAVGVCVGFLLAYWFTGLSGAPPVPQSAKPVGASHATRKEAAQRLTRLSAEISTLLAGQTEDPPAGQPFTDRSASASASSVKAPPCAATATPALSGGDGYAASAAYSKPYPNLAHSDPALFVPGSLDMARAEVFRKCFVSPTYYKEHFYGRGHQICAKSAQDKLMYLNIPKSGSSSSRTIFAKGFGAQDNQQCSPSHADWPAYKKVAVVRDPLTRFYAGYDEAFARVLTELNQGQKPVEDWMEMVWRGIANYKEYEKVFDTPETVRRFEAFVQLWDGRTVVNDHIRLQSPVLAEMTTGMPHPMDYIGLVSEMVETWDAIGALVGKSVDHSLSSMRGRTFPRRFNISQVSEDTQRRICRLAAIDYCCLNFPLPPACQPQNAPPGKQVYCQWVNRGGSRFIEPFVG